MIDQLDGTTLCSKNAHSCRKRAQALSFQKHNGLIDGILSLLIYWEGFNYSAIFHSIAIINS